MPRKGKRPKGKTKSKQKQKISDSSVVQPALLSPKVEGVEGVDAQPKPNSQTEGSGEPSTQTSALNTPGQSVFNDYDPGNNGPLSVQSVFDGLSHQALNQ